MVLDYLFDDNKSQLADSNLTNGFEISKMEELSLIETFDEIIDENRIWFDVLKVN